MKQKLPLILAFALLVSVPICAQKYKSTETTKVTKTYKDVEFSSEKTLLENLSEAADFSIYRGFLEIHGEEIFTENFMGTVFVIANDGFADESVEEPKADLENNEISKKILQFHIVPGRVDVHSLKKAISKGGGTAGFATLSGEQLHVKMSGETLLLFDSAGNTAEITATDLYHKHGFFHIVNGLVLPSELK